MALRKPSSPHGTVMAVSMMKDEAPYLLEWFAHHLAVGFTDILVYTNDCSDGTDDMLIRLEELGLGYHRRNDIPEGRKPQPSALKYAQKEPLIAASDWVLVLDADEFLCINHPSGHLDGLLEDAVARDANGIVITWRVFGSGHVIDWSRDPVTEQYLHAAPVHWNMGWGVKTLFRFDPEFWNFGIHRPKIKNRHLKGDFPDQVRWLNGSGKPMEAYFRFRGWRSIRRTVGYDWAQINHYAVKGVEAYALRKFRGNVNNKKDKYNAEYWSLQDRNEVRDTAILRHRDRRAAIMDDLLRDPVLNRLHTDALERAEARLADYRKTPEYETFRADLLEASKVPIGEVRAKPPQPRDPIKIAALMSEVEKTSAARPKSERRRPVASGYDDDFAPAPVTLQPMGEVGTALNSGVRLPLDAGLFSPGALERVDSGKYARRALRTLSALLPERGRLLCVGGEAGVTAISARLSHPGLIVMSHLSRADLTAVTGALAALNGVEDPAALKPVTGPLVFDSDEGAQATGFDALLRDFRPEVLRLCDPDITPERLAAAWLVPLRRIILPDEASAQRDGYAPALAACGFAPVEQWAGRGIQVFDRTGAPGQPPQKGRTP